MNYHVETFVMDRARKHVAQVIDRETGKVLHTTRGHDTEDKALQAADRWVKAHALPVGAD